MTPTLQNIYNTLFERIISGQHPVNTVLTEEKIAQEFKVSRTPAREVLKLLEFDGLIETKPKKGYLVLGFSIDDVEEIYEIRKALEILALKISISKLSIQKLIEFKNKMIKLEKSNDFEDYSRLDGEFHSYILDSSEKKRLINMIGHAMHLLQRFRDWTHKNVNLRKKANKEHMELIDALCMRDLEKSKKILQDHLEEAKLNAISHILNNS
jgi:DNA-binding GntR family transcriptional regulator